MHYTIRAYYVKNGKKKFISEAHTKNVFYIGEIMHTIATNIISDINNGKFDDIPENYDTTISPMLGDHYNRYRFIGIPSSHYFCIMCHMLEDDKTSYDTIMFRGCKIHVDDECVITIDGHKILQHEQYASFHDIFCRIADQFESTNSIISLDNPYRAVLMKFDSKNHVTFENASYVPYGTDMVAFTRDYLTGIRDKEFPRSEVRVQPKLSFDFEPSVFGFITTNYQKHEHELQCVPVYTVTDGKTTIYRDHPIVRDNEHNKYIVTSDYEVELGRFDSIDAAYDFIDRKEADDTNRKIQY